MDRFLTTASSRNAVNSREDWLRAQPEAACFVDKNGRIVLVNSAALSAFGYSFNELSAMSVAALFPAIRGLFPLRSSRPPAEALTALRSVCAQRKDGSRFNVQIEVQPLGHDEAGLMLIRVYDLDDAEQIRLLLQRRTEELDRTRLELRDLGRTIARDLQAPLRTTCGYAGLLNRRHAARFDADEHEYIGHILRSCEHLEQLSQQLLAYLRIGEDSAPELLNLNELAAHAYHNLRPLFEDKGAKFDCAELPWVYGDHAQLLTVFHELFENALKFNQSTPARIRVTATRHDGAWQITVRDNGIGVDPARAHRAFRLCERLHSGKDYPGLGIGLAQCRRIIESHGGSIRLSSTLTSGTAVSFTLPRHTPSLSAQPLPCASARKAGT